MLDIHPDDLRAIQNITGWTEVPEKLHKAYVEWIRMKHKAGFPGPLGGMVVPCLWALGVRPKEEPKRTSMTDWRGVDLGCPVQVLQDGNKLPGVFAGLIGGGSLSVRLNGDMVVHEYLPHQVQLIESGVSSDVDLESLQGGIIDEPDSRVNLLNAKEREADAVVYDEPPENSFGAAAVDAGLFVEGDQLMVELDGVIHDAVFVKQALDNGKIVVRIEDDEKTVKVDQVSL